MKKDKILKLIWIILFCIYGTAIYAQQVIHPKAGAPGTWRLMGSVQAKHTADHDAIVVAGPYDHFRRLKFKVTSAPLTMKSMIVTYDDHGLPEKINTRFDIPPGGESRVIDLKGGSRKIRTVEFWYETKGFLNGKANVTLFGVK